MRFRVTKIQVFEVADKQFRHVEDAAPELEDSIRDDLLDGQDTYHETSDGHFDYVPREVELVRVEKLEAV